MNIKSSKSQSQKASAVLVVLVLLGLLVVLMMSNTRTLNQLHTNLRLIEQKQLQNAGVTNSVTKNLPPTTTRTKQTGKDEN